MKRALVVTSILLFTITGPIVLFGATLSPVYAMVGVQQADEIQIGQEVEVIVDALNLREKAGTDQEIVAKLTKGQIPFNAYAMNYVAQSLYQVGGQRWKTYYPKIRDAIVKMQEAEAGPEKFGSWGASAFVGGKDGQLYGTSVAVFTLAMPNRYLPILQKGEVKASRTAVGRSGP